jgi:hypothetical protein
MKMRRVWCICICVCAISCGGKQYGDHPPHPVSGRIVVNGQPADKADILFFHAGDWGEKTIIPIARTDDDGTFKLSTYDTEDGAPNGEYEITIVWPAYRHGRDIGPDRLGGKYAKRGNGLKATIETSTNVLPPFELAGDPAKVKGDTPAKHLSKQEELNKKRKDR